MKKTTFLSRLAGLAAALLLLTVVSGCAVANNDRTVANLVDHFIKSGVPIQEQNPAIPEVVGASEALMLKIDGKDVGVYKYNKDIAQQKRRIEKIERDQSVYFIGMKFPAVVRGSFLLVGVDENPRKAEILEAFEAF